MIALVEVAKTYGRVAVLVLAVIAARQALAGTAHFSNPEDAQSQAQSMSDLVEIPLPEPLVIEDYDAATVAGGPQPFTDATESLGGDANHEAQRDLSVGVSRENLATLIGTTDPTAEQIDAWVASTLSYSAADHSSASYMSTGQAWGDYDNDGDLDLFLTNQVGANHLLENQGGSFTRSPWYQATSMKDHVSGGATFVDYDNDGWPDLHVLGDGAAILLRNMNGKGFENVTGRAGIAGVGQGSTAAWADIDGDGDLDAYVANYGCQPCLIPPPVPRNRRDQDQMFFNDGDGTFTDMTHLIEAFEATRGLAFSAVWLDFDDDGDSDLYVGNDVRDDQPDGEDLTDAKPGDGSTPGNLLLRNDGAGCSGWCFTDVSESSGAGARANAMGIAVGDYDANGTMDLFFTNSGHTAGATRLLSNQGDGTFDDVSAMTKTNLGLWSWGANFLDANADGRLDIYVAVGHADLVLQALAGSLSNLPSDQDAAEIRTSIRAGDLAAAEMGDPPPWDVAETTARRTDNDRLLLQQEDGTYTEVVLGPVDRFSGATLGSAVGDADGDGRPDVLVGNLDGGYRLLRGSSDSIANRLVVRLVGDGVGVPTDPVGATVTLTSSDGRRQVQEVALGGSLGSGDSIERYFGMADASPVRLDIHWPDGSTQRINSPSPNSRIEITQGRSDPEVAELS